MIQNPLVSIVIPIYGVEDYISKCAESVFEQTYENIEFLFVNDCTKDKSIKKLTEVIAKYPHRQNFIHIINHSTNKGLSCARISGIEKSSGDYIYHLDGDDWITADTIELLVRKALENNLDMVVAGCFHSYESFNRIFIPHIDENKDEYISHIIRRESLYSWTIWNRLIKRSIQLKAMPVSGINMGEDFITVPRLIDNCSKYELLPIPTYYYRLNNNSSLTKKLSVKSIKDLTECIKILTVYFQKQGKFSKLKEDFTIGKTRIKTNLYLMSDLSSYGLISDIYPEITETDGTNFNEKIILFLGRRKLYHILFLYQILGLKTKKIIKRIFSTK